VRYRSSRGFGEHELANRRGQGALQPGSPRTFPLVDGTIPEWLDQMILDYAIIDPQSAVAPESLIEEFVLSEQHRSGSGALLHGLLILLALFALAAVLRCSHLGHLTLKPWLAIVYSLLGCILSAMLLYGAGRWLGRRNVMRLAGRAWVALTV